MKSMIYRASKLKWRLLAVIFLSGLFAGCESLDDSIGSDPYSGGKEPLGIKLLAEAPSPASGYPGDMIEFKAKGLLEWCKPEAGEYQFKFYMGEVETPVHAATDSTLTVIVPENLSTGITYLVLQNQVFYGPTFNVLGNISIDNDYALNEDGVSGTIYDYLESKFTDNAHNYYFVGDFLQSKDNKTRYGITLVDDRGNVWSKNATHFNIDRGLQTSSFTDEPYLKSVSYFDDGQMLVSGSFSMFESSNKENTLLGNDLYVNNIAVLEKNCRPDTINYNFDETLNEKGQYAAIGVSAFNGGFKQPIVHSFVTSDQKVLVVGNLTQYCYNVYARWYKESTEEIVPVASVVRMLRTGELDDTYRNVKNGRYTGATGGSIADAYMDKNNGVVLVGSFTSFDGVQAPGIVRLDADGNVDQAFMQKVGTGPDGNITMIRYNEDLNKAMIVGAFSSFSGVARQNVAMLHDDGALDETFTPLLFEGGAPNFAALVDKEKVIVAGTFIRYDGVPRQGFLVLDMNGKATQRFNIPGPFLGQLQQVIETETTLGNYGLLLLGNFTRFNGERVRNVLMLEADFDDEVETE